MRWMLRARENGVTLADYLRILVNTDLVNTDPVNRSPRIVKSITKSTDPYLLEQIKRIGINLNQIAKWANTFKRGAQAFVVINNLIKIEHEIKKIGNFKSSENS